MPDYFHSVTLDKDKCLGCTNCIKRCPTKAIRVQEGKARIFSERCIDCGECIRVCPHHAKIAVCDTLDVLKKFEYTVALPAPSLYAQVNNLESPATVVEGLKKIGFDDVFEVAKAAELISDATRKLISSGKAPVPLISSACPSISRLIRIRFPGLIEHLSPLLTPAELSAKLARQKAVEKTGLPPEKIGTVFISPCPAKAASIKIPLGLDKSNIDAAIPVKEIYPLLVEAMPRTEDNSEDAGSGRVGVRWGKTSGESHALLSDSYLAADGIENCIKVLNDLEDEKLNFIRFIELNSCPGGCVGGALQVENPFVAKTKILSLTRYMPPFRNVIDGPDIPEEYYCSHELEYIPVMELDPDMEKAFAKMDEIDRLVKKFPGLDCGSCGSPSCRSLAEDIVRGYSTEGACVFVLKDEVQQIANSLSRLTGGAPLFRGSGEGAANAGGTSTDDKNTDEKKD